MAKPLERKDRPASMRLPESDDALIDRAARALGRSRTEFVREAAVRAAEDVLMDKGLVRMSGESLAEFIALLEQPAEAVPALVDVLRRPAPWDTHSDDWQ
ncbi:DUF1778 domain-containing protein [Novosphingobium sp. B1]|uniref:type II toxin-antitoxin system TacA family antitoxin n=1 Tax=Novosphingobium sp. B1 TaxID=1938756 RepID=UPI0009D7D7DE|nr:DUF1778 domain-containing protein [Novosphingobium sp. B1]SMC36944.1 Uncharacterized conserved protein, DUF1778 family [Novosphingobium sp. B1]